MVVEDETNEIREELNLGEIETNLINNIIPKPEEFGKSSRRDTHFIRLRYVPARRIRYVPTGRTINFFFGLS